MITIIGGGLAGSEAAWQIAKRGGRVTLYEMRPKKHTPAHKTGKLAELLCSNSFRSDSPENAAGLLKEELRALDSLILKTADETRVPAGSSLAVDREKFSAVITHILSSHANVKIVREEASEIPENSVVIVATGPLTSNNFVRHLKNVINREYLYFYDAISPIIDGDSINYDKTFFASRYDKGGADYLNCPMTKEEYYAFHEELTKGEKVTEKDFENVPCFESCMPVEDLAHRGKDTLAFGPMKPVGLKDPGTDGRPFAVVQLRKENREGAMYNIVGFQTRLTYSSQGRIFKMIPGLEEAEFLRYGSAHRNTFINSPQLLLPTLQLKENLSVFFAGQITGVEGYIESAASGAIAGINALRYASATEPLVFPDSTCHGALLKYITTENNLPFQPMHINFGLFSSKRITGKTKREKRKFLSQTALSAMKDFLLDQGIER